jgi:alkylhydroperoxidase family enzyme
MSFINTISPAAARDRVRAMYAREQQDWGYVPDYAKVFCHRPEVMERWGDLLAEIRRPVDPRRMELATFAAAYETRHSPCSLAHGAALAKIIGKEAVLAMAEGREAEVLDPAEVAILRFARQIARDASRISRADIEELREVHGLDDGEIFDIAANAASRCFFTKLLDALGADADSPLNRLDPDLCRSLTVGRPISERPVESLPERDPAG